MISRKEINRAIEIVEGTTEASYRASQSLEIAKRDLETAKLRAISKGVEGKNAEERKANLEINLEPRKKEIESAQGKYNDCKLGSDLAHLELTRINLTIRLMELIKK